ncbi:hypothetical protein PMAYCL1PPCAC_17250, partial [Pristionchus mayeri]
IVPIGFEGLACVYSGLCAYYDGKYACFLLYSLVLHGFTAYNLQMTFCYRQEIENLSEMIWCFLYAPSPEHQVRELIRLHSPQYDFSDSRLIGLVDVSHSWALPSIILIVCTAFPCTLINILVGRAISSVHSIF